MILREIGEAHPENRASAKNDFPSLLDLLEDTGDPLAVVGSAEPTGALPGGEIPEFSPQGASMVMPGQSMLDPDVPLVADPVAVDKLQAAVESDLQSVAGGGAPSVVDPESTNRRAGFLGRLMGILDSIKSSFGGEGKPVADDLTSLQNIIDTGQDALDPDVLAAAREVAESITSGTGQV